MRLKRNCILIAALIGLSACQGVNTAPSYNHPCTYRAIDAGFCEDPTNFRLFDALVTQR